MPKLAARVMMFSATVDDLKLHFHEQQGKQSLTWQITNKKIIKKSTKQKRHCVQTCQRKLWPECSKNRLKMNQLTQGKSERKWQIATCISDSIPNLFNHPGIMHWNCRFSGMIENNTDIYCKLSIFLGFGTTTCVKLKTDFYHEKRCLNTVSKNTFSFYLKICFSWHRAF